MKNFRFLIKQKKKELFKNINKFMRNQELKSFKLLGLLGSSLNNLTKHHIMQTLKEN